jgi:hypothetical protein
MNAKKLQPTFPTEQHGTIAFVVLFIAFLLTGLFSLFPSITLEYADSSSKDKTSLSGSVAALALAAPASILFGFIINITMLKIDSEQYSCYQQ